MVSKMVFTGLNPTRGEYKESREYYECWAHLGVRGIPRRAGGVP